LYENVGKLQTQNLAKVIAPADITSRYVSTPRILKARRLRMVPFIIVRKWRAPWCLSYWNDLWLKILARLNNRMQEGGVRAAFLIDHFYKQAPLFRQSEQSEHSVIEPGENFRP
jgi:hypothetical protein